MLNLENPPFAVLFLANGGSLRRLIPGLTLPHHSKVPQNHFNPDGSF